MIVIPNITEQTRYGQHHNDIMSRLFQERIIFISGKIEDELAHTVVAQLLYLEYADPKQPIYIYINSTGGSVTAGNAIIDTMDIISCPVATICYSTAFSMASVILSCGTRGMRSIYPRGEVMIHTVKAMYAGRAADIAVSAERIEWLNKRLLTTLAVNTNKNIKDIERITGTDYFMSAKEALDFGIVDNIITKSQYNTHG